jgi:predicted nucleic acid-binding protein
MPVTHLLDSSVFSQPIKDKPVQAALDRWSLLGDAAVCTAAMCLAEVLQGLKQRDSKKYWRRYHEFLEDRYEVLPFDTAVADTFASLSADLLKMGNRKPAVDLFIAATAKHNSLIVATLNTRDFVGIPGLAVEDWSAS